LPASLHVAIAIKKWREGAFKCVILSYSALPPLLAGVAAWVVTSIQSQRTPTVSQFDPFSPEEKAKNLPTQEWLDRNMWPNNVD
jgi:hypothetical protein